MFFRLNDPEQCFINIKRLDSFYKSGPKKIVFLFRHRFPYSVTYPSKQDRDADYARLSIYVEAHMFPAR